MSSAPPGAKPPKAKGELADLKNQITLLIGRNAREFDAPKRELFKKVINFMTIGMDMSSLFTQVGFMREWGPMRISRGHIHSKAQNLLPRGVKPQKIHSSMPFQLKLPYALEYLRGSFENSRNTPPDACDPSLPSSRPCSSALRSDDYGGLRRRPGPEEDAVPLHFDLRAAESGLDSPHREHTLERLHGRRSHRSGPSPAKPLFPKVGHPTSSPPSSALTSFSCSPYNNTHIPNFSLHHLSSKSLSFCCFLQPPLHSSRVPNLLEYVLNPVQKGLTDQHPYVRRTAVMGVLKMYHMEKHVVEENKLPEILRKMLLEDPDAQVGICFAYSLSNSYIHRSYCSYTVLRCVGKNGEWKSRVGQKFCKFFNAFFFVLD